MHDLELGLFGQNSITNFVALVRFNRTTLESKMVSTHVWDHQQTQEEVEEEQHDMEYSLKHKIPKVIYGTLDEDACEEEERDEF